MIDDCDRETQEAKGGRSHLDIQFLSLRDEAAPEQYISKVTSVIYDSSSYHFDRLFEGPDSARARLEAWVRRPSSEFAIQRATVALLGEVCAGAVVDLSGEDLMVCHKADTLALMKETRHENRKSLLERLDVLRDLSPPVSRRDYYLRSIGVEAHYRGRGLGRRLFERYIQNGLAKGFHRFRLDVLAENAPAIELYSSFGFEKVHEVVVPITGWRIWSMVLDRN